MTVGDSAHDAVAVGAFERATAPLPHGTEELGRLFLDHHRDNAAAIVGALLMRLERLERERSC